MPHGLPEGFEPNLEATAVFDPPNFTWPGGTHVCVVEVDTETGEIEIVRYVAVDDCGVVINPMIVEGQVHGGVAQGIAEALYEEAIYDDDGQPADRLDDAVPRPIGGRDARRSSSIGPRRRRPRTRSASRGSARPARSPRRRRSSTP